MNSGKDRSEKPPAPSQTSRRAKAESQLSQHDTDKTRSSQGNFPANEVPPSSSEQLAKSPAQTQDIIPFPPNKVQQPESTKSPAQTQDIILFPASKNQKSESTESPAQTQDIIPFPANKNQESKSTENPAQTQGSINFPSNNRSSSPNISISSSPASSHSRRGTTTSRTTKQPNKKTVRSNGSGKSSPENEKNAPSKGKPSQKKPDS